MQASGPGSAAVGGNTVAAQTLASESTVVPLQQKSWLRHVLFGPQGLRAVWGLLIFLALFFGLLKSSVWVLSSIFPAHVLRSASQEDPSLIQPRSLALNEGLSLLCVALATFLMSKIEHRPAAIYGIGLEQRPRRWWPNFLAGLAWGLVFLSLLVFALHAAGMLVFNRRLLFGFNAMRFGAIWLGGFLLVGLFEEYFTRGYLQFTLTRGLSAIYDWLFDTPHNKTLGFWTAALVLSFAFGFNHRSNPGESPLGLLSAGLAGFVFSLSLWRTGSLWWAIGFHTAWDWAQSYLYSVPNSGLMVSGHLFSAHATGEPYLSGGLTGPEGSIYLLPTMALTAAAIFFTLPRTHRGYEVTS
jgi:membrane protease YdiL (CAAX protease family)